MLRSVLQLQIILKEPLSAFESDREKKKDASRGKCLALRMLTEQLLPLLPVVSFPNHLVPTSGPKHVRNCTFL